jgi:hypothetical protein
MFWQNITYHTFADAMFWRNITYCKVGDLSPKGRVGGSRLDVVFGRQLVIAYRLANRFPTEHRGKSAIADVMFWQNITYHTFADVMFRRNITYHPLVDVFYSFCLYFSVFVVSSLANCSSTIANCSSPITNCSTPITDCSSTISQL